jgi:hypothetical protein
VKKTEKKKKTDYLVLLKVIYVLQATKAPEVDAAALKHSA